MRWQKRENIHKVVLKLFIGVVLVQSINDGLEKIYNPTVEFYPSVLFPFMKCNLIAGLYASAELIFQAVWCGMVMSQT